MSGQVHSGYVNILEDMLTERRLERDLEIAESLRRPVVRRERESFPFWVLIIGALLGVLASCGLYFLLFREEKPAVVAQAPVVHDGLAQEVALMKQILTGLVGAVKTLESERAAPPIQAAKAPAIEPKSDALRVVAEHANLRDRPDRGARSLAVVPKNTFLLGEDFKDGWYRVTTPLGELAWISEEVVTLEGAP